MGVLAYLGLGEAAALHALATAAPQSILLAISAGAIASGFFAIGTVALLGQANTRMRAAEGHGDTVGRGDGEQ